MQANRIEDAVLIERFRQGDREAMDALVNRHRSRAYAHALRLSHDHDLAADVVAETFMRVNRGAAGFKEQSAFSTWLHTLTRNCYLDLRRVALSKRTESLDLPNFADGGVVDRHLESSAPSPHDVAERRARASVLCRAVERLPEDQRALVVMFHVEMLTYYEIADRLHLPLGTVKSRLHRARTALRPSLEADRFLLGCDGAYVA